MGDSDHYRMQNAAYETAASLTGGYKPSSDYDLRNLLKPYAIRKFAAELGCGFGDVPPDSGRARGVQSAFITSNSDLGYLPNFKIGDYPTGATQNLYSGLSDIPQSIRNASEYYIAGRYERTITTNTLGSWALHRIDKVYHPENLDNNPVRQIGIILAWYDIKDSDRSVSLSYVFTITMIYELPKPKEVVLDKLLNNLCNKIRSCINDVDDSNNVLSDPLSLQKLMQKYAKEMFQVSFGFEYKGVNSTPPDLKPGGRLLGFQPDNLILESWPATITGASEWMKDQIMSQEGADVFPQYAQYSIYDNIRDNILRCATGEFKNNTWYLAKQRNFIKDYEHQPPHDLQQFACYTFIQGELELNVFGTNIKVQRLFVGYLGLFTSYDRAAQAKEVPFDPKSYGAV